MDYNARLSRRRQATTSPNRARRLWLDVLVLGAVALAVRLAHSDHPPHFDELYGASSRISTRSRTGCGPSSTCKRIHHRQADLRSVRGFR